MRIPLNCGFGRAALLIQKLVKPSKCHGEIRGMNQVHATVLGRQHQQICRLTIGIIPGKRQRLFAQFQALALTRMSMPCEVMYTSSCFS